MSPQELETFYAHLALIVEKGNEKEVRAYIDQEFPRLPPDVQSEITLAVLSDSMKAETEGLKEIMRVQERGVQAMDQIGDVIAKVEEIPQKDIDDVERLDN